MTIQLSFLPKLLIVILLLHYFNPTVAQEVPVTIRIINQKKDPVPSATIVITNRLDSSPFCFIIKASQPIVTSINTKNVSRIIAKKNPSGFLFSLKKPVMKIPGRRTERSMT